LPLTVTVTKYNIEKKVLKYETQKES
jgi:hypothetical protein